MSRASIHLTIAALMLLFVSHASAQVVRESSPEVQLSNRDTHAVTAPASTPATLIPFVADPVSSGGDLFDVVSADSHAVITLVLPDGREINSTNAQAQGFTYTVIPQSEFANSAIPSLLAVPGTHTVFELPGSLPAGTYKVKVNTSGITTGTLIIATYISLSPVQAGLVTDAHVYRIGETVVFSGLLFEGATPITGATVTVRIGDPTQPASTPLEVTLTDSGPFDAAPGDGLYTGTFTTTQAGKFAAAIHATGVSSAGASFSRTTGTTFRVIPPLATMSTFSDQGIDDDANGLFNRVVVTANVNVQTAGKYQLAMNLVASNGAQTKASTTVTLAAGAQQVKVSFPAQDLFRFGVNGPYAEKNVTLIYQDDPEVPVVDYRENAGNTSAYALTSLERPSIFLTGQNSDLGVDSNANGKFDILKVKAGVNVSTAGSYQWSASLVDRFGTEIDFASNSGSLVAGSNTIEFNFDGKKIGINGTDGPYAVHGLLIFGSGNSLVALDAFNTSALSASLFEGFANQSELSLGQSASSAQVQTGSTITYTIVVTNNGPNSAINTTVNDTLPAQTTLVSCTATGGGVCGGTGNNRVISYGYLDLHQSETVMLVAQVDCALANNVSLTNSVAVSTTRTDPVSTNNSGTSTFTTSNPPPVVTSPANIKVNSTAGACTAVVNPGAATVQDNCAGATAVGKRSDGKPLSDPYPVGTTTIQWTATDTGGNTASSSQTVTVSPLQALQLSAASLAVSEADGQLTLNLTRNSCDLTGTVTVDYATANGTASQKSDFTNNIGTITFGPNEINKTITLLINEDNYVESDETLSINLSNASGNSVITQAITTVTIKDNDTVAPTTNPLDTASAFVRQQYHDFLNREPDTGGLDYWTNEITKCGPDTGCVNARRIAVSAAFFIEQEFQQTGFYVYRVQRATLGDQPTYTQYIQGRNRINQGSAQDKVSFTDDWVLRPAFLAKYQPSLSGPDFIDALLANIKDKSKVDLSSRRAELISDFNANGSRARIVRKVVEYPEFSDAEYNPAFVLAQYFSYLRRDPEVDGYLFWLDVLNNKVPGNFKSMVCAFITSQEYQERFSPIITHHNTECAR